MMLVEDITYSLLSVFNVSIPVIYGEGNRAVGRFLEHIIAGSGNVTILAWTRHVGGYNSCLPSNPVVYDQLVPPHIPQLIDVAVMDVATFHSSWPDLSLLPCHCMIISTSLFAQPLLPVVSVSPASPSQLPNSVPWDLSW